MEREDVIRKWRDMEPQGVHAGLVEDELGGGWLCVPTLDGNVHVIPASCFLDIIEGKRPLTEMDEWEVIMASILKEWLEQLTGDE